MRVVKGDWKMGRYLGIIAIKVQLCLLFSGRMNGTLVFCIFFQALETVTIPLYSHLPSIFQFVLGKSAQRHLYCSAKLVWSCKSECIGVLRHMQRYFSYICDGTDVQADWSRWTYGRAPNAIDISYGSLTCPSKHRHGATLFIRLFRETAPFSRFLRHAGDTEDVFSS